MTETIRGNIISFIDPYVFVGFKHYFKSINIIVLTLIIELSSVNNLKNKNKTFYSKTEHDCTFKEF